MVTTGQREVRPEAIRSTVGNVGGIILRAVNAVIDLEEMAVEPSCFASIGSAVASADTTLRDQQVSALRSLLALLQQANDQAKRTADDHDASARCADRPAPNVTGGGMWSGSAGTQVAAFAVSDSVGETGEPYLVHTVIGYLISARITTAGRVPPIRPPTSNASAFTAWLDTCPENQAALGVIATYSGPARSFADVPGGLRDGDLVIVYPGTGAVDGRPVIGIVATSGRLYNNGLVKPDFGELASLRVYRPMSG
ncbi:MAG TPA: WXG100 family type VII secretion target [Pseudonocardiaceae bacterium]|jgi:hypothetical protein|nr:WXG100 family type VII secretion target [Pseudonocardiaceae bacterium]